jgi:hypothetical protein
MQPHAPARKHGLIERATIVSLVVLFVVSALGVALVTTSLNRIDDSTDSLDHRQIMADYAGRPAAVIGENGAAAVNFAVLATSGDSLRSAVIVNLSASRRNLTLITIPADLVLTADPAQTLESSFAIDPATAVQSLETYTGTRMDHQILLDLDASRAAIDNLGGIRLGGREVDGASAVRQILEASDADQAATATGVLIKAVLLAEDDTPFDFFRSSRLIEALPVCVTVDTELTGGEVRALYLESSVHPTEIRLWPLSSQSQSAALLIDQDSRQALRTGLSSPNLVDTPQYQAAAYLPEETRR